MFATDNPGPGGKGGGPAEKVVVEMEVEGGGDGGGGGEVVQAVPLQASGREPLSPQPASDRDLSGRAKSPAGKLPDSPVLPLRSSDARLVRESKLVG